MKASPPDALGRPAAASDVDFAYALILGRSPEDDGVRNLWASALLTLGGVMAELLQSAEFAEGVAQPWASGEGLPPRFVAPLTRTGRTWARSVFGEAAVAGADTWLQLLLRLHALGVWEALGVRQGRPELAAGLQAGAPGGTTSEAAVLAQIEGFDGRRLQGWAIDLAAPGRPVRLELWVQGRYLRALSPDRFRREVQDRYGGTGRVEFDLAVGPEAAAGKAVRLEIRVAGGRVVAEASATAPGADRLDAVAAVRAELAAVRAVLERVERAMPDLRARTSFSLASYGDYARLFGADAQPCPVDAGGDVAAPVAVVVRRGSGSAARLEAALASLLHQTIPTWTAFVAPDALGDPARAQALLDRLDPQAEPRLRLRSTEPAELPEGGLVIFMSADDRLAPGALHAFVRAQAAGAPARVFYADDDCTPPHDAGEACDPRLKPPFDRYLALQENYVGSVLAVDAGLAREAKLAAPELSDHARLLRAAARVGPSGVRRLARVLSHRAEAAQPEADPRAAEAELARRGLAAAVEPHADLLAAPRSGALRLRPQGLEGRTASVIIATRDRPDLLGPCVRSLLRTRSDNRVGFDVVVIDNGGVTAEGEACLRALAGETDVRVVRDDGPFNWALLNTRAARAAAGEVLVFLNDDTLAVSPAWCDELCWWALQAEVGAVGARLLYEDGAIQHAGVVLGRGNSARHEGVGEPGDEGGYLGRRLLVHATAAVTGACLATRADVFHALGGFDGARFPVAFNDMDYCLRAREMGLDSVYTPHATFHHFESKSRGFGDTADPIFMAGAQSELAMFQQRHAAALDADPWMNPRFEREAPAFTQLASRA